MRPAPEPNFDRVARIYRWAEYASVGRLLQRVRTHFIGRCKDRRQALILGDGDGRFLALLLQDNPKLRAYAVDSSAAMLALLEKRCAFAADRLTTEHTSVLNLSVPAADLVTTHFLLDCFPQAEVETILSRISGALPPNALWLHSDFGLPESGPARLLAIAYVRMLYLAFRVLTGLRTSHLPNTQLAFERNGFTCVGRRQWLRGLVYTELWQRSYNSQTDNAHTTPSSGVTSTSNMSFDHQDERPENHFPGDAIPDPEPAAPSLPEPDPGIFHHVPGTAAKDIPKNA